MYAHSGGADVRQFNSSEIWLQRWHKWQFNKLWHIVDALSHSQCCAQLLPATFPLPRAVPSHLVSLASCPLCTAYHDILGR